jgi:hypothetical protein
VKTELQLPFLLAKGDEFMSYTHMMKQAKSPEPAPGKPDKIETTMSEFKSGDLHSGSDNGPKVTNRKQAIAIALSQQRKANAGKI